MHAQAALIPVPAQLFEGSLLLGGLVKAGLGQSALAGANVLVHPLLVAGWCSMVSTALNLLPVGRIDGGRMMQVHCCAVHLQPPCRKLRLYMCIRQYFKVAMSGTWPSVYVVRKSSNSFRMHQLLARFAAMRRVLQEADLDCRVPASRQRSVAAGWQRRRS